MQGNANFYVSLIYLLTAIPYAWLGLYAWRKRPAIAVTPFAWAMLGMSIWALAYGLEIFFRDLDAKLFFVRFEYIGIVSIPVFLFIFALDYTGRGHLLTVRNRALLWILPVIALFLTYTNDYHHLMWDQATVVEGSSLHLLTGNYRPFFWVHLAYSYILLAITSLLLIMELIQRPGVYRVQNSLVILGIIFPWFGNIISLSNSNPIPNLDLTPLFFIPTGLGLSWAITRYRLFDVLPLEHLTVLQNMKNGVVVLNSSQRVLYMNPIAESLFGHSGMDVIGQPLSRISGSYGETLASFLTSRMSQTEIKFDEAGQAKVYEVSVSTVSSSNVPDQSSGPDRMMVFHDITGRKETESALSRRESIMSAISLAAGQFLKEPAWEHNVPGVLEKIGQAAEVSRVYVFMNYVNEKGGVYTSRCYEWAAPGVKPQINNPELQHILLRDIGFRRWEDQLSNNLPIHGPVREFPESERPLLGRQNILSLVVLPIFVESQWWGFVGFDDCLGERHWTNTEMEAFHTAASIFAAAETRARTEQKLIRRQRTLNLLHEIVRVSLQSDDLTEMSQTLVDRLGDLIKADGCFLTLWDENKKQTLPIAAFGRYRETYRTFKPEHGKSTFTELSLKAGYTLTIEDVNSPAYAVHQSSGDVHTNSVLVLPLIAGRNKLGAIILTFDQTHRFQKEEIAIGEQAASLIALALERFQAMEQARQRALRSETLRKAGATISETLETDKAVFRILEQLKQVLTYDSASVQLLDGNELKIIGGSGFTNPEEVIGMSFAIPGDNPNTTVIQTGQPYLVNNAGERYEAFLKPPNNHINSWLGVPLVIRNKVIGLLAIDSSRSDHFTNEDMDMVTAFAHQVAIVLENTRLFEEVQGLALTDPLTGLYNRRGLFELNRVEFARSIRAGRPYSGIMIDIDHFKEINDTYGHSAGDQILRELANRCKKAVREIDYVIRYGGEEIIILLPETDMTASLAVAERLRAAISGTPMRVNEDIDLNITASLGVAQRDENTPSLETLIARADQAMYIAKHKGRDRVAISK